MGKEKSTDVEMVDASAKVNGQKETVMDEASSKKETDMITLDGRPINIIIVTCLVPFSGVGI